MGLALLLVPIELVSYIFRPISLAVRLFANMMAGHTLLKVIAGFAWTMMLSGGALLVFHLVPLFSSKGLDVLGSILQDIFFWFLNFQINSPKTYKC